MEAEILERINSAREVAGVPLLEMRQALLSPARLHSLDMAQDDFFAHEGQDKRVAADRVAALDRTLIASEIRENIARITGDLNYADSGSLLHSLLINSEGHRKNILSPTVTHVAIGVVRMEKGAWVTQVFANVEGELAAPLPFVP